MNNQERQKPTNPPQPVTDQEAQEWAELCQRATPGPWYYNGYSTVFSGPKLQEEFVLETEHAAAGEPWDADGNYPEGYWRDKANAAESQVANTPAAFGDTAVGRHRADAAFIAAARDALPRLLAEWNALKLRLRVLELEREQDNAALLLSTWDNQDAEKLLQQALSCLEDMAWQFASRIESNGQLYLSDSGLSALESAFDALGWESPHAVDPVGLQCEHAECIDWSAGATIMPDNMYVQLCSEHLRHAEKTVYPVKDWAKNRESWRDENNVLLPGWTYDRPRG